jgi:predicted transcriptional regulator
LLLTIVTALLGVKCISGKKTEVITIPVSTFINIRKTDKAVILAFINKDGETAEQKLLKIDKKDFEH